MENKSLLRFGLIVLFLFTAAGLSSTRGIRAEETRILTALNPYAEAPWYVTSGVDYNNTGNLGAYPSLAYSPVDGLPYISYYDSVNGDLMLAHFTPDGSGNCGWEGSWDCEVIDGDGLGDHSDHDVGKYSSLDFYKSTSGFYHWKMGISYYDASDQVLKYAVYNYIVPNGGDWDYVTVTPIAEFAGTDGKYSSFKYNGSGIPQIAYYAWRYLLTEGTGFLKIATQVTSGGNCGIGDDAGKWECTTIDSGDDEGVGKYASLDIDYDDQVYIAYYDAEGADLKCAYYTGAGSCLNGWECKTVDSPGDVGAFASIKARLSANDKLHIAYYDKSARKLKYASSDWSIGTGNCGNDGSWQCLAVDTIAGFEEISQTGISLDIDTVGAPIIAYQYGTAPKMLNIARPAYVYEGTGGVGNCGDITPGGTDQYWQCDTIDESEWGNFNDWNVADYVSVEVNPNGLAGIAYFRMMVSSTPTNLAFTYQRLQTYLPLIIR